MLETNLRLVCDECKASSEEFDGAIFTRSMVFAELRQLGWVRSRGGRLTNAGDKCPRCNPNHQEEAR